MTSTKQMDIILASTSPRRKELLEQMGLQFRVMPSDFEEYFDETRSVHDIVKELARGKAMVIAQQYPNALVVGGDTLVSIDGKQLGKPSDYDDALAMLEFLAGRTNQAVSGLSVICIAQGVDELVSVSTDVVMKSYDEVKCRQYLDNNEFLDKAGTYAIQGGAAPLIEYVKGSYTNIMGLPVETLHKILETLGVHSNIPYIETPVVVR